MCLPQYFLGNIHILRIIMKSKCIRDCAISALPTKSILRRSIFAVAVLLLLASICTIPAAADQIEISSYEELRDNISSAPPGVERIIVVMGDFGVSNTLEIDSGKNITLMPSEGNTAVITKESTNNAVFNIIDGTLTIRDNKGGVLTLQGHSQAENQIITVQSGNFTMEGGKISGNTVTKSGVDGGGIKLNGGTFTMNGGTISGNTGGYNGGGVYVHQGTFTMNGGTISGNTGGYNGGGVDIYLGTFTMNNGEISDNTGKNNGGGVFIEGSSIFAMNGGIISGNKANSGGGVSLTGSTFTMSGSATIAENNELYLDNGQYVSLTGTAFTGTAKNITGHNNVIVENYALIRIIDGSFTAQEIQDQFKLRSMEYKLVPSTTNPKDLIVKTLPLEITTSSPLPYGTIDEPYNQIIEATGIRPLTWTCEPSLPPGLILNKDDGTISGTPTRVGIYTFLINVTNSSNDINSKEFTLIIRESPSPGPEPQPPSGSSGDGNMENAFRVLFDTQGGSTIAPATGLSYGDRVAKPADPVRDGYTFGGWYTDAGCTQSWDFTGTIPGDMTLYAKWTSSSGTTATTVPTTPATTATPAVTQTQTTTTTTEIPVTPAATDTRPTLVQTPASLCGVLAGLLAAGVLLRKKD